MNQKILVMYKSVTGFTREYAEWIAGSLEKENDCTLMELKDAAARGISRSEEHTSELQSH